MQYSNAPVKLPAIWGFNAKSPYINPIPVPSQQSAENGRASFADGFPPNCFIPVSAGGAGPFGGDFNGIFQQITAGLQFTQAGVIYPYDSNFQSTIGGYPNTAIVGSVTKPGWLWQSTVDNNMTNPDQGGAGWISLGLSQFGIYGLGTAGQFTSSSNYTMTVANCGQIGFFNGTTAATWTLPAANSFPAYTTKIVIRNIGSAPLTLATASGNYLDMSVPIIQPGQTAAVVLDGNTTWRELWNDAGNTGEITAGTLNVTSNASIGNILNVMTGVIINPNGNSSIILGNGSVSIVNANNSAYLPLIASTLNLVSGLLTNTNNNSGIVLASGSVGAVNAGNTAYVPFNAANGTSGNQVVNFSQFSNNHSTVVSIPNLMLQFSNYTLTGPAQAIINLPQAFPNACLQVICSYDSGNPTPTSGTCGGAPYSNSQIRLYNSASSSNMIRYLAIGY